MTIKRRTSCGKRSKRRKCWSGYRRVPGKKAGSKGSCRKIKSKKRSKRRSLKVRSPVGSPRKCNMDNIKKFETLYKKVAKEINSGKNEKNIITHANDMFKTYNKVNTTACKLLANDVQSRKIDAMQVMREEMIGVLSNIGLIGKVKYGLNN